MKKNFFTLVLAFAMIVVSGMALTACGGGKKDNSIKISVEKFDNQIAGVASLQLYSADFAEMEAIAAENDKIQKEIEEVEQWNKDNADKIASGEFQPAVVSRKKTSELNVVKYQGNLYANWENQYPTVELAQSKYFFVIRLELEDAYRMDVEWLTGGEIYSSKLKVELKGQTFNFFHSSNFKDDEYTEGTPSWVKNFDGYVALVAIDEPISSNTTIKLKGETTVKTYNPISFKAFDKDNEVYNDLMFKVTKGNTPIKYNNSEEIAVGDLLKAIDANPATYFEDYHFVCYFKDKAKFFPDKNVFSKFFSDNIFIKFDANHDFQVEGVCNGEDYFRYDQGVVLDFSAFDDLEEKDLTHIKLNCGTFAGQDYVFIVDGEEVASDELTLVQYQAANKIEIRYVLFNEVAGMYQNATYLLGSFSAENATELTSDDITITPIPDNEYESYYTINLGNYKSYQCSSDSGYEYLTISLTVRSM